MAHTFVFVMDPMDRILPSRDTGYAFMVEAFRRGHRIIHVLPSQISLQGDRCWLRGQQLEVAPDKAPFYVTMASVSLAAADCTAIFVRTEPPFDEAYLTATWLLSFAEKQGVWIVNSPKGLRTANEKLYALEFPSLCPPTIVTNSKEDVGRFFQHIDGDAIAKPIDGYGGYGVVKLRRGDSNINAIVDVLTHKEKNPIVVQEYVKLGELGDKRLFLVNGVLRGGVIRVPSPNEHRNNLYAGGHVEPYSLTDVDHHIGRTMGDTLQRDGLFFVGLDVIGDKLIEVNVTSPTLIQELRRFGGPDLAKEMIDLAEQRGKSL